MRLIVYNDIGYCDEPTITSTNFVKFWFNLSLITTNSPAAATTRRENTELARGITELRKADARNRQI